ASVAMGDACMSQGLQVIPLSKKTGDALKEFVPTEGRILVNPMDVWGVGAEPEGLIRILDLVFSDPNVDVAIIHIATRIFLGYHSEETFDAVMDALIDFRNKKGKHIVAVLNPSIHEALQSELAKKLAAANIPSHPTFERAAKAIVNVSNYWRTRASAEG
ncbi:MAG: hypothetical protein SVM79_10750, partial [Chloroflexota bacterium]|nr:hypothetical protein [Chloroflexota bacterium]